MRKVALLLWLFALTSCAEKVTYLRTDGQDMAGMPMPSWVVAII
jgi:hypothetical protein